MSDATECKHEKTMPTFDKEAAANLSVAEIRKRWPRFWGKCPDCGASVIAYASFEHYVMGDW